MNDRVTINLTQKHLEGDATAILGLVHGDILEVTFEQADGSFTRVVTTVGVMEHTTSAGTTVRAHMTGAA